MKWLVLLALALSTQVAFADADCKHFTGGTHGESACIAYDLHAHRLRASTKRVMPADHPAQAGCDDDLVLGKTTIRVVCEVSDGRATVSIRLATGTMVLLDKHTKGFDFIHVWAKKDDDLVRFTIDYAWAE